MTRKNKLQDQQNRIQSRLLFFLVMLLLLLQLSSVTPIPNADSSSVCVGLRMFPYKEKENSKSKKDAVEFFKHSKSTQHPGMRKKGRDTISDSLSSTKEVLSCISFFCADTRITQSFLACLVMEDFAFFSFRTKLLMLLLCLHRKEKCFPSFHSECFSLDTLVILSTSFSSRDSSHDRILIQALNSRPTP
jgi:hypothetical protein